MARPRKLETEKDRDGKRIGTPFTPDEFKIIAALADAEFTTLADTVHDLAIAGLASCNGEAPKATGLAASKETERDYKNRLLALEVARREGETLTRDQVLAFVEREYGIIRSRILNIPNAIPGLSVEQFAEAKKVAQDCMTDLSGESREMWDDMARQNGEEK